MLLSSGEIDCEKRDYAFAGSRTVGRHLANISDAAMTEPEPKITGSFRDWFVSPPRSEQEAKVILRKGDRPNFVLASIVWTYPIWFVSLHVFLTILSAICISILEIKTDPEVVIHGIIFGSLLFTYIFIAIFFIQSRWFRLRFVFILCSWYFIYSVAFMTQSAYLRALTQAFHSIAATVRPPDASSIIPVQK